MSINLSEQAQAIVEKFRDGKYRGEELTSEQFDELDLLWQERSKDDHHYAFPSYVEGDNHVMFSDGRNVPLDDIKRALKVLLPLSDLAVSNMHALHMGFLDHGLGITLMRPPRNPITWHIEGFTADGDVAIGCTYFRREDMLWLERQLTPEYFAEG